MAYQVQWEPTNQVKTLDVSQVVALEQAIAADGISLTELMDRAGASATRFIQDRWGSDKRVLIFCGTGNNGGDGWVVGRLLAQAGYTVDVVCSHRPEDITAQPAHDAAVQCMREVGELPLFSFELAPDTATTQKLVSDADIVVDALLGTGFHYDSLREPTHSYVAAIASVAGSEASVVAIDVPSGVNAQTGSATDPAVRADYTVTMMAKKTGMDLSEAKGRCGQIAVAHIADIEKYLA